MASPTIQDLGGPTTQVTTKGGPQEELGRILSPDEAISDPKSPDLPYLGKRHSGAVSKFGSSIRWSWSFSSSSPKFATFILIKNTCQAACHGKTEHGTFVKFKKPAKLLSCLKNQQNCCRPTCRCHHLGYSVPPALHRTIWCRSTFGPRGPGLSNPTSFLRPALPMAPTRDEGPVPFIGSRISKFLRPAQRYDDFILITYLQIFAPGAAL